MRHYIITTLAALAALPALAQLDNTVEVTGEVKPVATDARKVDTKAQAAETNVTMHSMEYDTQEPALQLPFPAEQTIPLDSKEVTRGNRRGHIQIGGGSHGIVDSRASWLFDLTNNDALRIGLSLEGMNGTVLDNRQIGVTGRKARDYRSRAEVSYTHRLGSGADIFVKGDYTNRLYNYLFTNTPHYNRNASLTDKQHDVSGTVAVGVTPIKVGQFTIDAAAGADFFQQKYVTTLSEKLGETFIHAHADVAWNVNDNHAVGLGYGFHTTRYRNDELDEPTSHHFTPHYSYASGAFALKLGAFVCTDGDVAPDAEIRFRPNSSNLVYLQARGYEEENSARRLSAISPYFAIAAGHTEMRHEFHPLDIRVGYRLNHPAGFSLHLFAGYDTAEEMAEMTCGNYAPSSYGQYNVVDFMKSRTLYASADLTYSYGDLVRVDARNRFNSRRNRKDDKWHKGSNVTPVFEMDWRLDVRVAKGLHANADWQFATYTTPAYLTGPTYQRPNTLNLAAGLRYAFPTQLPMSVFVKADNLLGRKQDRYLAYRSAGTSVAGGFTISF